MPVDEARIDSATATDRRIALVLFFLGWTTFVYFAHGGGWGINAFVDLTRAIVEQGSFDITDYVQNTGDWAQVDGRYTINKNPGTSFLAVPAYFAIHALAPHAFDSFLGAQIGTHLTVAFSFALLSAAAMSLLYLWIRRFASPLSAVLSSVVAWMGTMNLAHASMFNAGNVVACCYVIAAYGLWKGTDRQASSARRRAWLFITGLGLGYAVLTEPISVVSGLLFIPALLLLKAPWKQWLWIAAGGLPAGMLLAFYNLRCFGSMFASSYQHQNPFFLDESAFLGVFHAPSIHILYYITLHPVRGLFWGSPALLLGLAGLVYLWKDKSTRPQAMLVSLIAGAYFLFNSSFNAWHAGWTVGPRYLSPMVPLWAAPVALALDRSRILRWIGCVLAALSIAIQLMVTAVTPMAPDMDNLADPIGHYVFPLFRQNLVSVHNQSVFDYRSENVFKIGTFKEHWAAYNAGELMGLRGRASLVPLLVLWFLFGLLLFQRIRGRANS